MGISVRESVIIESLVAYNASYLSSVGKPGFMVSGASLKAARKLEALGIVQIWQNPPEERVMQCMYAILPRDHTDFAKAGWSRVREG